MREIAGWIGFTPVRLSQIMNLFKISINVAHQIAKELVWDRQKELFFAGTLKR